MTEKDEKPLIIRNETIDGELLIDHCHIHGDILILNCIVDGEIKAGFTILDFIKKPKHILEVQSMTIKNPINKIARLFKSQTTRSTKKPIKVFFCNEEEK